jgi:amidophosphoribosyltransferase
MATGLGTRMVIKKDLGFVKDAFDQPDMLQLVGNIGIGHTRYPTAGTTSSALAQPFYTNFPLGIALAHNGNLTNSEQLRGTLRGTMRHVNTESVSALAQV